jgi:hypothetical protein
MPFGLGFFATAGAGGAAGSFDLLESQVLGSTTASVTFSSLSSYASTYQHLQLRILARHTSSNGYPLSEIDLQFNGDTASNYSIHGLVGDGGSVTSYGATNTTIARIGYFTSAQATTGAYAATVLDILDPFETTKYKTLRSLTGVHQSFDGTDPDRAIALLSGSWRNTNAVTSLTLFRTALSFASGSRFSLYGIRAV